MSPGYYRWLHVTAGVLIGISLGYLLCLYQIQRVFSFDTYHRAYALSSGINYTRGCLDSLRSTKEKPLDREAAERCRSRGKAVEIFLYDFLHDDAPRLEMIEPPEVPLDPAPLEEPKKTPRRRPPGAKVHTEVAIDNSKY